MAMSTKMRSFDATYTARTRSTRAKTRRQNRSADNRRTAGKQSAHTSVFSLALSVGIVGSVGVIAIISLLLLGG